MCNPQFDNLMAEVECINRAWGWVGVLDAIMYIQAHESDYEGTAAHPPPRTINTLNLCH